jgi:ATP-binding protein involved in chromosome partitioning
MTTEKTQHIRYAVPAEPSGSGGQRVCAHFGHCAMFALIDVDLEAKSLLRVMAVDPPSHEPGILPQWLHDQGVNTVLAGGMGQRAIGLFHRHGIDVITGVTSGTPEEVVLAHLNRTLRVTDNTCDH